MHRGSWKSSYFPRIAGVQWSSTVGSTLWGMASGVAIVLGIVLVLWRSRRRPASPSRGRGRRCRVYRLSRCGVAAFRGPCRPGSCIYMCASGSGARDGPGPLQGGDPGLRLQVLSVPP